jgi:hypothetical protein
MATQVTLKYQADPTGTSSIRLAARMNAFSVPVPPDVLQASGLRVISDTTPVATPVVRTIVLGFDPTVAATISTVIEGGSVTSITRLTAGMDYVTPPPVSFVDEGDGVLSQPTAQTFLEVEDVAIVSGGADYSAASFAVIVGNGQMVSPTYIARPWPGSLNTNVASTGDLPPSTVQALKVSVQGRGYSTKARIRFDGSLDSTDPNARQAQAIVTEFGPHGEILAVQITDPGQGYIRVPKVTVQEAIPFGIEIVRKPDAISGAVVTAPNIVAPGAATAILSPIMGQGAPAGVNIKITAGAITAVSGVVSGNLFTGMPEIVVVDPAGTGVGAVLKPRMGLSPTIQITNPGRGLSPNTSAVLTSFFRALFPDTVDQRAPFFTLMQPAIATKSLSPIKSFTPVLA